MPPSDSGVGAAVATGVSAVRSATLGDSEETGGAGVDTTTTSAVTRLTSVGNVRHMRMRCDAIARPSPGVLWIGNMRGL